MGERAQQEHLGPSPCLHVRIRRDLRAKRQAEQGRQVRVHGGHHLIGNGHRGASLSAQDLVGQLPHIGQESVKAPVIQMLVRDEPGEQQGLGVCLGLPAQALGRTIT